MKKLLFLFPFLTFSAFGQQFPIVEENLFPTKIFSTQTMIQGGFELIGVSNDYSAFNFSDVDQLYEKHLVRSIKFIEDITNQNILFDAEDALYDIEIPFTEQPPPAPPIPNSSTKYTFGKHLRIVVDTTQIISIPDYIDNSFVNLHGGETVKELYESELDFLSKFYKTSSLLMEGYPVLIENVSDLVKDIETLEGWVFMIQEALDEKGNWKPIEYIDYRVVCGNSYGNTKLLPDEYFISKIYKYGGDFRTKLRVRFSTHREVYFSNEFIGQINYSQFDLLDHIDRSENVNEHFLKNNDEMK